MVKRRVIFINVPRVVELVIAGANSIQTGAMVVLRNARLRGQRAQLRRRRKRCRAFACHLRDVWDWVDGPDTRCAGPRATADVPWRTLATTSAAHTQTVRFEARRQRVCVLRVAPILDVDRYAIRPGKAVDFLWGVLRARRQLAPAKLWARRGCGKNRHRRDPFSTAYGNSVAPDCCSSAALGRPGGAHCRAKAICAMVRQRNSGRGTWDFSARSSAGGAATRGARA